MIYIVQELDNGEFLVPKPRENYLFCQAIVYSSILSPKNELLRFYYSLFLVAIFCIMRLSLCKLCAPLLHPGFRRPHLIESLLKFYV